MSSTAIVITTLVILAGIWELFAALTGKAKTFSRVFQAVGITHPFVIFAIGYICGHIFGFMPFEPPAQQSTVTESKQ